MAEIYQAEAEAEAEAEAKLLKMPDEYMDRFFPFTSKEPKVNFNGTPRNVPKWGKSIARRHFRR